MHVFPEFSIEDLVIRDPARFHTQPVVNFASACFVTTCFSPFPLLDVEFRVWVPDSQVLVGQVTCVNNSDLTRTFGVDWRIQLQPIKGGSPMKQSQNGLNTTLQGECTGLFPEFYLTGGAYPSISDLPGLGNKILLLPGARRQVTWALASLSSAESSKQLARQYSSSVLDVEQIKIEMADERSKVHIETSNPVLADVLERTQDRAYQLVMSPLRKHAYPTYISDRSPDTGNYHSEEILEIHPEWAGQTLTEVYLLAQILLPGRPEIVKGMLQNFLNCQQPDGRVDLRASPNHNITGHSSLPMLVTLVSDLHQYLDDPGWLAYIYPKLLAFLKTWLKWTDTGVLEISELTHPLQLGFSVEDHKDNLMLAGLWIKLKSSRNLFLPSLLYRETSELLQISRWIKRDEDREWLEKTREHLKLLISGLWSEKNGTYSTPDLSSGQEYPGVALASINSSGLPRLKNNIPSPGKLFIRIDHQDKLPANFCCQLSGFTSGIYQEVVIKAQDFQRVEACHVFVTQQAFTFIESMQIMNLPPDASGEIGMADLARRDVLNLLPIYAGIPSSAQANKLLSNIKIKDHLGCKGLTLDAHPGEADALTLPSYFASILVEGLVKFEKYNPANQVFKQHFLQQLMSANSDSATTMVCSPRKVEEMVPLRLFLKLHGLMKLTNNEVVISHFDGKQEQVNVKYNKLELMLRHNITEIHMQSGDVIYLNQPGLNKIVLE